MTTTTWLASPTNYLHLPWQAGVALALLSAVGVAIVHARSR